jgi:hypothetical protein
VGEEIDGWCGMVVVEGILKEGFTEMQGKRRGARKRV